MKHRLLKYAAITICSLSLLTLPSCNTLSSINKVTTFSTSTETTNEIILDAEKTIQSAQLVFTEFLKLDKRYKDLIVSNVPEVHTFANSLREKVPYQPIGGPTKFIPKDVMWLEKADAVLQDFKKNRTAEGKANLVSLLNTIKNAVTQSSDGINKINALKGP